MRFFAFLRRCAALLCLGFLGLGNPSFGAHAADIRAPLAAFETFDEAALKIWRTGAAPITSVRVRFAVSSDEQARGLMHVTQMADDEGMVFVMTKPRPVAFWMRNTRLPLDMIFIAPGGQIADIVTRMDTGSDAVTRIAQPMSAVLELKAGQAAALGLAVGDQLRHAKVDF
jgi:uncharacterized membrane protein (UPF0127 family)